MASLSSDFSRALFTRVLMEAQPGHWKSAYSKMMTGASLSPLIWIVIIIIRSIVVGVDDENAGNDNKNCRSNAGDNPGDRKA